MNIAGDSLRQDIGKTKDTIRASSTRGGPGREVSSLIHVNAGTAVAGQALIGEALPI